MKIGITASRNGINELQRLHLCQILGKFDIDELHHGDCIGGDAEAHYIAQEYDIDIVIVIHPPIDDSHRAFCQGAKVILPKKDYLKRNADIVDSVDLLIAMPDKDQEALRSGTWATVRYAKKQHKPTFLLLPNGKVETMS
jgi:hypothetical protein